VTINREAVEAALEAFYGKPWKTWFDWERDEMSRALSAALPHLLAAKDAEIAALQALLTEACDNEPEAKALVADAKDAEIVALRPTVSVQPMRLSSGDVDYYVALRVGDRKTTPFMFRNAEWKAAYEADHLRWVLLGGEKPDLMAYSADGWPARAALEISGGVNERTRPEI
jgi:hypothetical protein